MNIDLRLESSLVLFSKKKFRLQNTMIQQSVIRFIWHRHTTKSDTHFEYIYKRKNN